MSEISDNIKTTFENILKIYNETASLILDADELMDRSGYTPLRGAWMETEYSRSLEYPNFWLAQAAGRYYKYEKDPKIAKAIGVLFLDGNLDVTDPIIVSTSLKCRFDEEDGISPYINLRKTWFLQLGERSLGENHEFGEINLIERGKIRGILLENVTNHETLEKLVVEPLLAMDLK